MTLLLVLMVDVGVLMIVSAVQDVTLIDVFRAVWTGQPIPKAATGATSIPPGTPATPGPTGAGTGGGTVGGGILPGFRNL